MNADVIAELMQSLRQTSAPPDGACQRLTVPVDGVEVHLVRSSSRAYVRTTIDELMAEVDQFQAGRAGVGFSRGPRRDGKGAWWALVVTEKFSSP